jgi:hypothetical protein
VFFLEQLVERRRNRFDIVFVPRVGGWIASHENIGIIELRVLAYESRPVRAIGCLPGARSGPVYPVNENYDPLYMTRYNRANGLASARGIIQEKSPA